MRQVTLFGKEAFPFAPDREEIFRWLGCSEKEVCYETFRTEWEPAVHALGCAAVPQAALIRENDVLTVFLTLGLRMDECIAKLFRSGSFVRASLLNAMADQLLFQADRILTVRLREQFKAEGLFLAERLEPGSSFVPSETLIASFREVLPEAALSEAASLRPSKSMLMRFLLSSHDCGETGMHDCARCPKTECPYRGSESRGAL